MKRSLLLSATLLLAAGAQAGSWQPPKATFGEAPQDGLTVKLYSVEAGLFVTSGKISAPWASSAILGAEGLDYTLAAATTEDGTACWTITTASGSYAGKQVFTPYAEGDAPYLYNDMGYEGQGGNKWIITEDNGTYQIAVTDFTNAVAGTYVGTDGTTLDLRFNVDPVANAKAQTHWAFFPTSEAIPEAAIAAFAARQDLYTALNEAEEAGVATAEAETIYNNEEATADELRAAAALLRAAITEQQMGGEGTEDDPLDITHMLLNPAFDEGTLDGWTNNGLQYQGASYSNENSELNGFAEKWTWNGNGLGVDAGISQTLSLPAGHYRLEADAIATCQSDQSVAIEGVKLYANSNVEFATAVATANEKPQHFSVDFLIDGTAATTLGFSNAATSRANWIAVDNFRLTSYGKSDATLSYFYLTNAISAAAKYAGEDMESTPAQAAAREAFTAAYDAAQDAAADKTLADEAYDAAREALSEAVAAYAASVTLYANLNAMSGRAATLMEEVDDFESELTPEVEALYNRAIDAYAAEEWGEDSINALINEYNVRRAMFDLILYCDNAISQHADDIDLSAIIEGHMFALEADWHTDKYQTTDQVAAEKTAVEDDIQNYLNAQVQPGDDITSLIQNASMQALDGWQSTGAATPALNNNVAEVYQNTFDIHQTLKNMPKGRYTLTVQAFQRCGWGANGSANDVNVSLYAADAEAKINHITACAQQEALFTDGSDTPGYPYDSYDANYGWFPNSMEGADRYFSASPDNYKVTLDFFLLGAAKQDLTLGLRGGSTNGGWWTLFDNFTLTYQGNNAADYADAISALEAQIAATLDGQTSTDDLNAQIADAEARADKALADNDADACVALLDELRALLATTQQTVAATDALNTHYGLYTDYLMDAVESSDTEFQTILDEIATAIAGCAFKDLDEVAQYEQKLRTGFTRYAQHDGLETASEDNPYDITPVILGHDGIDMLRGEYSLANWDVLKGNGTANENGTEFYNNSFDVCQTLYGLAPGYYKLRLQGYYRPGSPNLNVDSLVALPMLYAGQDSTRLHSIYDDARAENDVELCSEVTVGGQTMYIPNRMSSGAAYFAMGLYQNMLVFNVPEGQDATTIGLRKNITIGDDWTMYSGWKLEYVGATQPAEESTAVERLTAEDGTLTAIYSLDGKRLAHLQKGINLLKRTDKNGRTTVVKILR